MTVKPFLDSILKIFHFRLDVKKLLKMSIQKRVRLFSWIAFIGSFGLVIIGFYNSQAYIKNLESVVKVLNFVDANSSQQLKDEVVKTINMSILNSEMLSYIFLFCGVLLLCLILFLGISIKRATDKKIHSMDWIVEG